MLTFAYESMIGPLLYLGPVYVRASMELECRALSAEITHWDPGLSPA